MQLSRPTVRSCTSHFDVVQGRSVSAIGTSHSKHPETELAERIALCSRVLEGYGNGVSVEASTRCSWTFSPSTRSASFGGDIRLFAHPAVAEALMR